MKYIMMLLLLAVSYNIYAQQKSGKRVGLLSRNADTVNTTPYPVRNDTAAAYDGMGITTIRYSKIKKGTFPLWLKVSEEGVWPYFAKLGARVIGAWQVVKEDVPGTTDTTADYDEVYLMTRYVSFDHWKATRDPAKLGGNGPDYQKCLWALKIRDSITYESTVRFLKGTLAPDVPYFLPGLPENYQLKSN
jgi:hypothetical protein